VRLVLVVLVLALTCFDQRRKTALPKWTTSTWMRWASAWDAAVCRSPSSLAMSTKPGACMMPWFRWPQSWWAQLLSSYGHVLMPPLARVDCSKPAVPWLYR
jgi:hypothetical protein